MTDASPRYSSQPKPGRRWLRLFFRAGILLFLLLLIAYFVVTSSAFIQGVVIPRVEKRFGAKIVVGDIQFSPLTRLTLHGVKVTPEGGETLFSAKLLDARYSLLAIMRGNILVEELAVDSPTITVAVNADGSSNLDRFRSFSTGADAVKTESSGAPRINIKAVAIKNATLRQTTVSRDGEKISAELSSFNVSGANFANGGDGRLDVSGMLAVDKTTVSPPVLASFQAILSGTIAFELTDDLMPGQAHGVASLAVSRGTGEFAELGGLTGRLNCDISPTEIKQLALRFERSGKHLGEARLSGPFDAVKQEGRLKIEVLSIDRQVLNLFGAPGGIDFAGTTVSAGCEIGIADRGATVSSSGKVEIARFQMKRRGQSTPALDVRCDFGLALDRGAQALRLDNMNLNVTHKARALLQGELNSPLTISLGSNAPAVGENATLLLNLTDLNLTDWKPFLGADIPAGKASARVKLMTPPGGSGIVAHIESQIENLALPSAGQALEFGEISLGGFVTNKFAATDMKAVLAVRGVSVTGKPAAPQDFAVLLDAAVTGGMAELRDCAVQLTPTARATNSLSLRGKVDFSDEAAITGNLALAADAVDATGFYDLFDSLGAPAETPAAKGRTTSTNAEPAAVVLPFRDLTADIAIGRFFLREVDAADFKASLLLNESKAVLQPFQLTLNGALVSVRAELDLGVPGWKYDLSFNANGVPLEPLANTFSPQYRGRAKGTLFAETKIAGAGFTGANLKKSLMANADLSFTNANIQLAGEVLKPLVAAIAASLNAPELMDSPLTRVTIQTRAADGKIVLPMFMAQNDSFQIQSRGEIAMADTLAESAVRLPVEVSVSRELAARLRFHDVPTNVPFMKLPDYVSAKGTLGRPKFDVDKSKLAGIAASALVDQLTDGKATKVLDSLLGGRNAEGGTNSATTNASQPVNLLDLLKKPKKQ